MSPTAGGPVPARPLVLIGAGGLGREALAAVRAGGGWSPDGSSAGRWDVVGFVDDGVAPGTAIDGVPVLGSVDALVDGGLTPGEVHALVCTGRPGNTRSRPVIAERLAAGGIGLATVVHPTASLAPGVTVGEGSLLLAHVVATAPIPIGRLVVVMPQTVFTHDDVVGDVTTFGAGVRLAGAVVVHEGAYVGSGALVREGRSIGAGALVGMGAVVVRDIPAGETWAGNPARRLPQPPTPTETT